MKYLLMVCTAALMFSCGEKVQPAEEHFANAETYAKWVDDQVGRKLAWKANSKFAKGDTKMGAWVGYNLGKPAVIRLIEQAGNEAKWYIYLDSANGKVIYFLEEVPRDGKVVKNRFSYRGDTVAMALASNNPYESPYGANDFRLKPLEVDALVKEVISFVDADIPILSEEANAARKENAQFYATGGPKSWSLVINPSNSSVTFNEPGAEERKFGYDVPATGPKNESIYNFNSLKGKIEVSIFSKACGVNDGKSYPYTVVIVDKTKSLAGCGVLLQ